MIDQKMVNVQKHPDLDLYVFNYSNLCQYGRVWNDVTLNCRGLIVDGDDNIIARPFAKFFNIEELSPSDVRLSKKDFQVFEKLDGSLGILYPTADSWAIATRGSFGSDQAKHATLVLREFMETMEKVERPFVPAEGFTYLFEIIYPENRIVVDYGNTDTLVFLCAVHNETGSNVFDFGGAASWSGQTANRYGVDCHPREVAEQNPVGNAEGYVIYFPSSNLRVKTKFEEYVRLHRIVTGVSTKSIWKSLMAGDNLSDILDNVPDEFYSWVREVENKLLAGYEKTYKALMSQFLKILTVHFEGNKEKAKQNRKEFADQVLKLPSKNNGLLFSLLDDKPVSEPIWRSIEPAFERPHSGGEDEE